MNTPIKKIGAIIGTIVALLLSFYFYSLGGILFVISFLCACVIAFLSLVALCTPFGSENYFDRHKKVSILVMTIAIMLLVISLTLKWQIYIEDTGILSTIFNKINSYFVDKNLFGYYTSQLSLTFITISVMSVLSDKSVIIYWSNVSEDMLIRPTFSCFAAFTYYSIGATIGSGLGVILKNTVMFVIFFTINIIVLICLTLSMIDVYYGRDTKKKKLAKSLNVDTKNKASYENKILSLEQNLLFAYDQKDVIFLREVYELYCEYPEKFVFDIGQEAIAVMASTLDAQTIGPFLRVYDKILIDKLSSFPLKKDEILVKYLDKTDKPLFDRDLWWILGSNRAEKFLEEVSVKGDMSTPNGMLFTRVIIRRLALEYNMYAMAYLADKIGKGESVEPNKYFVNDDPGNMLFEPKTIDENYVLYECFKEVFEYIKVSPIYNSFLFDRIILIIDRMLKEGKNWYTLKVLSSLPYIDYWANGGLDGSVGSYNPEVREAVKRIKDIRDSLDLR